MVELLALLRHCHLDGRKVKRHPSSGQASLTLVLVGVRSIVVHRGLALCAEWLEVCLHHLKVVLMGRVGLLRQEQSVLELRGSLRGPTLQPFLNCCALSRVQLFAEFELVHEVGRVHIVMVEIVEVRALMDVKRARDLVHHEKPVEPAAGASGDSLGVLVVIQYPLHVMSWFVDVADNFFREGSDVRHCPRAAIDVNVLPLDVVAPGLHFDDVRPVLKDIHLGIRLHAVHHAQDGFGLAVDLPHQNPSVALGVVVLVDFAGGPVVHGLELLAVAAPVGVEQY